MDLRTMPLTPSAVAVAAVDTAAARPEAVSADTPAVTASGAADSPPTPPSLMTPETTSWMSTKSAKIAQR